MPDPAPRPADDPPELAEFDDFLQRDRILGDAARLLTTAYYENAVLSVYKGLREPHDRFLHELVYDPSVRNQALSVATPPERQLLDAILDVESGRAGGLDAAEVDRELAARTPPGRQPVSFSEFLDSRLAARGGYPTHDAVHWLAHLDRARSLEVALRAGVHLDAVGTGEPPPEFGKDIPAKALAVARSWIALSNDRAALDTATLRAEDTRKSQPVHRLYPAAALLGLGGTAVTDLQPELAGGALGLAVLTLATAIGRSVARARADRPVREGHEQVAAAERVVRQTETDFAAALGPARPERRHRRNRPSPPAQPPRPGRR